MLDFMHMGGLMTWPLLALGLVAIATEGRRTLLGVDGALDARRLASAVLAGSICWSFLGVAKSLLAPSSLYDLRLLGVAESLSPTILGLGVFAIVNALASVGGRRLAMAQRQ